MTSATDTQAAQAPPRPDSATIIRDALVLQAKLIVDGLRDAVLIPVSFVAAVISIVVPGGKKGMLFYDVVRAGRRSERWINLFVAADRVYPGDAENDIVAGLDDLLEEVEGQLRSQNRAGEADSPARETIESILDRIRAARRIFKPGSDPAEDQ